MQQQHSNTAVLGVELVSPGTLLSLLIEVAFDCVSLAGVTRTALCSMSSGSAMQSFQLL